MYCITWVLKRKVCKSACESFWKPSFPIKFLNSNNVNLCDLNVETNASMASWFLAAWKEMITTLLSQVWGPTSARLMIVRGCLLLWFKLIPKDQCVLRKCVDFHFLPATFEFHEFFHVLDDPGWHGGSSSSVESNPSLQKRSEMRRWCDPVSGDQPIWRSPSKAHPNPQWHTVTIWYQCHSFHDKLVHGIHTYGDEWSWIENHVQNEEPQRILGLAPGHEWLEAGVDMQHMSPDIK